MPIVNPETKNKIHGTANLSTLFFILVLVGVVLWSLIPYWWLWLISMPIWGFGVMFVGERTVPLLTNGLINAIFKTR